MATQKSGKSLVMWITEAGDRCITKEWNGSEFRGAVSFVLSIDQATKNRGREGSRMLTVLEGTRSVECDAVILPCLPCTDCQ